MYTDLNTFQDLKLFVHASYGYPEGTVKVKYLEDVADDEALIYHIAYFILNANPVPCHIVDITAERTATSVSFD